MRKTLYTALLLLTMGRAHGQATLAVQSPDGKKVMLLWVMKSWPADLTGFDIKRKEGLADWVKLNREPILPGISMKKKLAIVDADKPEVNKLEAELYKLLATHRLKETETAAYPQQLATNEKMLRDLDEQITHNYDLALMNGFAYVDRGAINKTHYEYALFAAGTDKMLASVQWNYGQVPDLNVIHDITSRAVTTHRGITLLWDADSSRMAAASVAGFNIYRQGIRLNANPAQLKDPKEPGIYMWHDTTTGSTQPQQYSISAESMFGIEGSIKPYIYDPAEHPASYQQPVVTEITSQGYYLKEGINAKWTFPKEEEQFIKGFYVEKDKMPAGYKKVSALLDPATRAYTDKTASPVNSYIRMRVTAVYKDLTKVPGVQKLYSYFPVTDPPPPQNLKINVEETNTAQGRKYTVHLAWDPPMRGDDMTDYYRVYKWNHENDQFFVVSEDKAVRTGSFSYAIPGNEAGDVKFYVTTMGKSTSESLAGDTVYAVVPLPAPVITSVSRDTSDIKLDWQYPEAHWVAGFRLYDNDRMVADETVLSAGTRTTKVPRPEPGSTSVFTLRALSETGVESESSVPATISMPGGTK